MTGDGRPAAVPAPSVSRAALLTYAALVAVLVLVKILFVLSPANFPLKDQPTAFSWPVVLGLAAAGLAGLYVAPYAGFPDMWDRRISKRARFLLPIADGLVYGLLTVLRDLGDPSDVHLAFPASLAFYTFGAIFLEILLRLFGLSILTWLLAAALFRGRLQPGGFWVANIATSLYEPMPHIMNALGKAPRLAVPGLLVDWAFQPLFLANVLTGYLYRRYGFLTAVVLRIAFYLVWHIAYGGFGPFWRSL